MTYGEPALTQRRDRLRREIMTPEGVPLRIDLALHGERLAALLLDLGIIVVILVAVLVAALSLRPDSGREWVYSAVILISFLVRSFYFIFFELRWQGMTPGKRVFGLRVVDRSGQPLQPDAVFSRNLMREVELFMPITLLLSIDSASGLVTSLTLAWMALLMTMPWWNRDRLRAGDLVAGTWVIEAPKASLLPDIADPDIAPAASFAFTEAQLSVYGIFELQTLEDVLRQGGRNAATARESVAKAIQLKIGWQPPDGQAVDPKAFLEAFYARLRGHLEHRALLGKRRENKFDRS